MNDFNNKLIKKVKLFHSEQDDEYLEEKYSFIKYIMSNIESISPDQIEVCEEEFPSLDSNLDAYYYDEDSAVHNLYVGIYNDSINDEVKLSKNEIEKHYSKIINFLKNTIKGDFGVYDESSLTYEISSNIHGLIKQTEIVVNVLTNYNLDSNLKKDSVEQIEGIDVSFRTYDFIDLQNKFIKIGDDVSKLDCKNEFNSNLPAIKITSNNNFDVYLFSMKGVWLAKLYKEDSVRLLEANVRSYLKRTAKVNKGILETVKENPEEFVSFNNGISAVSTGIKVDHDDDINTICEISEIENFQIVNGGQTTATLYECLKDGLNKNLDDVRVPVKMTVIKNIGNVENFISNISTYSNTQTAIKKSDPPSNLPYYIQIKKLSQNCLSEENGNNYICYFERTNGEYETEYRRNGSSKRFTSTNPKNKKFDKIDLARAINCWEQLPYVTCQGKEKCFSLFNDTIKNQIIEPDEQYFKNIYSIVIMYRRLDKIAKDLDLTVKSNVTAHTLSYISYIYDKELDLKEIWELKDLPSYLVKLAYKIMPQVHNVIIKAPKDCPEPRMWARKERCWEAIKKIKIDSAIIKNKKRIDFYEKNDALLFISDKTNFEDTLTWMKLLLWDNKNKQLSKKQINIVKMMRSNAGTKSLTKPQEDYLKDIFMYAVKKGYSYK